MLFLRFLAFKHKKCWKWLFWPAFGVPSTQTLVKIYNIEHFVLFKLLLVYSKQSLWIVRGNNFNSKFVELINEDSQIITFKIWIPGVAGILKSQTSLFDKCLVFRSWTVWKVSEGMGPLSDDKLSKFWSGILMVSEYRCETFSLVLKWYYHSNFRHKHVQFSNTLGIWNLTIWIWETFRLDDLFDSNFRTWCTF